MLCPILAGERSECWRRCHEEVGKTFYPSNSYPRKMDVFLWLRIAADDALALRSPRSLPYIRRNQSIGGKMKPLVCNIRGNSGSGKTYTTRAFMELCKNRTAIEPDGKIHGYSMTLGKQRWVVIGSYSNTCGGLDTV